MRRRPISSCWGRRAIGCCGATRASERPTPSETSRRNDVQWLYKYLGGLTDEQIAAGLRASGGTESEIADFTRALRARLDQLKTIGQD